MDQLKTFKKVLMQFKWQKYFKFVKKISYYCSFEWVLSDLSKEINKIEKKYLQLKMKDSA